MADGPFVPGEISADLDRLEKAMKRLAVEYEMFLTQMSRWPPHQRLAEVTAIIRHYSKTPPRRTVERFRFNTLSHRHSTAMERWSRRLRILEEKGAKSRLNRGSVTNTREDVDINKPQVLAAARLPDGQAVGDQLRDFYLAYKQARRARGLPIAGLNYSPFAETIQQTLDQARRKAAGSDLELRVDEVGGKVRITVRTLRKEEPRP